MCAQMDDGDACRPRAETRAGGDLRGLRGGMERRARRCREGFAGACAQSGHATRLLDAEGARSRSPLVTGHGRADGSSDGRGVGGAAARTRKTGASADPVVHMQSTAWVDMDESRPPSGPGKSAPTIVLGKGPQARVGRDASASATEAGGQASASARADHHPPSACHIHSTYSVYAAPLRCPIRCCVVFRPLLLSRARPRSVFWIWACVLTLPSRWPSLYSCLLPAPGTVCVGAAAAEGVQIISQKLIRMREGGGMTIGLDTTRYDTQRG